MLAVRGYRAVALEGVAGDRAKGMAAAVMGAVRLAEAMDAAAEEEAVQAVRAEAMAARRFPAAMVTEVAAMVVMAVHSH